MFNLEENRVVLPEKCEVTGLSVTKGGYFREMKMQPPFRRRLLELMEVHQPDDKDLINPDGVTEYGKWVIKCPLMAKSIKIKWEINCLRHGFGSHYRAFTRNINLVAEDMGTDRAYVKKHYSRGVRVSETRSWLELSDDWNPPAEDVR